MSPLFSMVVLLTTAAVVVALFAVLWRGRTSRREGAVALASGVALALWAATTTALARGGFFEAAPGQGVPPVGINFVLVMLVLASSLALSASLRGLLSDQATLVRLHLWRFLGVTFLILMVQGRLPPLFALPAGVGDILIAATAAWIARGIDTPRGRRRAIVWNWLGLADLIVAIGLGVTTNPGAANVLRTVPSSEVMSRFPMALVPTFLLPLALTLHVVSLWQLRRGTWARPSVERRSESPAPTGARPQPA
jgi:hypothetical protein